MDVVVDASLLVEWIVAPDDRLSRWLKDLLDGGDLYWVDGLTQLEVASTLRTLVREEMLEADVAEDALKWLSARLVKRAPLGQKDLVRVWEMRGPFNPYDAAYFALTERLQSEHGNDVVFATADRALAESAAVTCPVRLYEVA